MIRQTFEILFSVEQKKMASNDMRFDAVDYAIFALLLIFSAAIGLFYGFIDKIKNRRKNNGQPVIEKPKSSAKEYLLANKSMGVRNKNIIEIKIF